MEVYQREFKISLGELGEIVNRIITDIKADYRNAKEERERMMLSLGIGEEYSLRTNGIRGTEIERAVKISPLGNEFYIFRTNDPGVMQILLGYKVRDTVEK